VNAPHPNVVLRGGPQPVGPRQIHTSEPSNQISWRAADGSGLHLWTRTGEHEEYGGVLLRVYVYAGVAEQAVDAPPIGRPPGG
jgi:hypothetical protein